MDMGTSPVASIASMSIDCYSSSNSSSSCNQNVAAGTSGGVAHRTQAPIKRGGQDREDAQEEDDNNEVILLVC